MRTDAASGQRFIQTHQCSSCKGGSMLVNRWDGAANTHEVMCPKCGEREHFTRPRSLTAAWRENPDSVPVAVANVMQRKHRKTIEAEIEGLPDELAAVIREKYLG